MLTTQDFKNLNKWYDDQIEKKLDPWFDRQITQKLDPWFDRQITQKLDPWFDSKMEKFAQEVLMPAFEQVATKEWTKTELKETEFRLERRIEEMESSLRSLINGKFAILAEQINSNMEKFYALIEIMAGKEMLTRGEVKKIAQAG